MQAQNQRTFSSSLRHAMDPNGAENPVRTLLMLGAMLFVACDDTAAEFSGLGDGGSSDAGLKTPDAALDESREAVPQEPTSCDLLAHARRLAGPGSIDCGDADSDAHDYETRRAGVDACILRAHEDGVPFFGGYSLLDVVDPTDPESRQVRGGVVMLVGTAEPSFHQLVQRFDSLRIGRDDCRSVAPTTIEDTGRMYLRCIPGFHETVCE